MYECYQHEDADRLIKTLPFNTLVFARQWFVCGELLRDLPPEDRITPIVGMLTGAIEQSGELRVEVPDTNESKELLKFCRKFTVSLRAVLKENGILLPHEKHLVLLSMCCLLPRGIAMWAIPTAITTHRFTWVSRV